MHYELGSFQSTLPLRGATDLIDSSFAFRRISIHAPLAGSDISPANTCSASMLFQSTLPLRGATQADRARKRGAQISIHAPLAGSDGHGQQGRDVA